MEPREFRSSMRRLNGLRGEWDVLSDEEKQPIVDTVKNLRHQTPPVNRATKNRSPTYSLSGLVLYAHAINAKCLLVGIPFLNIGSRFFLTCAMWRLTKLSRLLRQCSERRFGFPLARR